MLKIANAEENLEVLDLQNRAIQSSGGAKNGLEWPRWCRRFGRPVRGLAGILSGC